MRPVASRIDYAQKNGRGGEIAEMFYFGKGLSFTSSKNVITKIGKGKRCNSIKLRAPSKKKKLKLVNANERNEIRPMED